MKFHKLSHFTRDVIGQHYRLVLSQPRSQGLSSLPPLVVGRKTLVAAGHMTTQDLGGKKICRVGGVAEYFVSVDVTNFVGFKSSSIR